MRSIFVVIILVLYLNKDLKKVLIDSASQNKVMMAVTIMTGSMRTIITYTAVRFFTLTTITIFANLGPVLAAVLGICWLGESATMMKFICIVLSFTGALCMTLAAVADKQKQRDLENEGNVLIDTNPWLHLAMMFAYPIVIGINDNTKRKLKGLHENARTLYMAPCLIVICSLAIHYQGVGFDFVYNFSLKTYLMLVFISGFNVIC